MPANRRWPDSVARRLQTSVGELDKSVMSRPVVRRPWAPDPVAYEFRSQSFGILRL